MSFLIHITLFGTISLCVLTSICSATSDLSTQTLTSTGEFVLENGITFTIPNVHRKDEPQFKLSLDNWQIKNVTRVNATTRAFKLRKNKNSNVSTTLQFSIFQLNNKNVTEYYFEWRRYRSLTVCFHHGFNNASWYNGYQSDRPKWPMDTQRKIVDHLVRIKYDKARYSILEHLYVNSDGFALLLDASHNFHMATNPPNRTEPLLCFKSSPSNFRLYVSSNIRAVTEFVVRHSGRIPKATQIPDEKLFRYTNYYTGERSKQSTMMDLANKLVKNGFTNSTIVVNSQWERFRGDFAFDADRFPNVDKMIKSLHKSKIDTCLEVYPTVSSNSSYTQSYLNRFKMIKFFNSNASDLYSSKLKVLSHESGVDCFLINDNLQTSAESNLYYNRYIATVSSAVPRATSWLAFRTQHLPIFLHLNFSSEMTYEEILKSVIPQALSVSIAGYSYLTVPIGKPIQPTNVMTEEIFIRTVQACALMPSMAFHQYPWKFGNKTLEITKRYVELHSQFVPTMASLSSVRVSDGSPIIRPMWYVAPDDPNTLTIDDQFMLGDDIVVAPVVKVGQRSRKVYLPSGNWIDHVGQNFSGPAYWTLAAPLDTLLYFKRRIVEN